MAPDKPDRLNRLDRLGEPSGQKLSDCMISILVAFRREIEEFVRNGQNQGIARQQPEFRCCGIGGLGPNAFHRFQLRILPRLLAELSA